MEISPRAARGEAASPSSVRRLTGRGRAGKSRHPAQKARLVRTGSAAASAPHQRRLLARVPDLGKRRPCACGPAAWPGSRPGPADQPQNPRADLRANRNFCAEFGNARKKRGWSAGVSLSSRPLPPRCRGRAAGGRGLSARGNAAVSRIARGRRARRPPFSAPSCGPTANSAHEMRTNRTFCAEFGNVRGKRGWSADVTPPSRRRRHAESGRGPPT